jgi:hypothetical protein
MGIGERKKKLEHVLVTIKSLIQNHYPSVWPALVFLDGHGLCHFLSAKFDDEILNDIQKVNNIKFEKDRYYLPFCEKGIGEIQNVKDLELWYEKRIEAVQNTIDYYNSILK